VLVIVKLIWIFQSVQILPKFSFHFQKLQLFQIIPKYVNYNCCNVDFLKLYLNIFKFLSSNSQLNIHGFHHVFFHLQVLICPLHFLICQLGFSSSFTMYIWNLLILNPSCQIFPTKHSNKFCQFIFSNITNFWFQNNNLSCTWAPNDNDHNLKYNQYLWVSHLNSAIQLLTQL